MHLLQHPRSVSRPRRRQLLVALLAPVLGAGVLVGGPTAAPLAGTTTPGAPPMPAALAPGSETAPVYPLRSVPAYAVTTNVGVRVKPYSGSIDKRYRVGTPAGSTLLWGDWNRDGAYTPVIFTSGHWVVYDAMIGPSPIPAREFDFGTVGDKPVVGDWNRDGRTDVGVVRGSVFLLRNSASAGATWRRIPFGRATDVPVTGDWDGDGRDGIGVRRGSRFFLRDSPTAGKPDYDYTFGWAGDTPVVGDWNGDGIDQVGVVRGAAWYLRSRSTETITKKNKPTVTKQVVPRPRDPLARPAPWPTPAGRTGAACPSAGAGVSNRPQVGATVVPSALLDKSLPYDAADPNVGANPVYQVRAALLESERYLLGAQYLERWFGSRAQRFTDILARGDVQEYAVRRPAMAALTTAVAARTKAHSDALAARTRDEAIRYTDWLVRSIACEHLAVTPGGWGAGWQTAHWAFLTGEAAWLVWDHLTPQTREYVAQMVVFEADHRLTIGPEYWADANGVVVSPGDTKAEEDSWNAGILELAATMMPKNPQALNWRRRAVDLETAAYSRFSDNTSTQVVNGVPLQERLDGSNIYDNGTLENHHVIHPDYMTNIQQSWWAADLAGLAGRSVPQSALHNAALVYGALSTVDLPAGAASPTNGAPYAAPGGTMYRPGSNDIYYPQGSVWGTVRRAHFVSFDAHALAYGLDSQAAWSARDALAQHVSGQLTLVYNNGLGDGRTYSYDPVVANQQESYNGREEYAASQVAAAWLALYVGANAWDKTFNFPPVDTARYAPLPPMTQAQTGWFGLVQGQSPDGERLSP